MQLYQVKGKIHPEGNLVIAESINLPFGEVEVIVLPSAEMLENARLPASEPQADTLKRKSRLKALEEVFENYPPFSPNFDQNQAKWEYLKEKHNL